MYWASPYLETWFPTFALSDHLQYIRDVEELREELRPMTRFPSTSSSRCPQCPTRSGNQFLQKHVPPCGQFTKWYQISKMQIFHFHLRKPFQLHSMSLFATGHLYPSLCTEQSLRNPGCQTKLHLSITPWMFHSSGWRQGKEEGQTD